MIKKTHHAWVWSTNMQTSGTENGMLLRHNKHREQLTDTWLSYRSCIGRGIGTHAVGNSTRHSCSHGDPLSRHWAASIHCPGVATCREQTLDGFQLQKLRNSSENKLSHKKKKKNAADSSWSYRVTRSPLITYVLNTQEQKKNGWSWNPKENWLTPMRLGHCVKYK